MVNNVIDHSAGTNRVIVALRNDTHIMIAVADDGEGIFFTSRVFDTFEIDSTGIKFSHDDNDDFDYLLESQFTKKTARPGQ